MMTGPVRAEYPTGVICVSISGLDELQKIRDFSYEVSCFLIISLVNHEVASSVLAHWADLRSLLADHYMTAV